MNHSWQHLLTHTALAINQYRQFRRCHLNGNIDASVQPLIVAHDAIPLLHLLYDFIIHSRLNIVFLFSETQNRDKITYNFPIHNENLSVFCVFAKVFIVNRKKCCTFAVHLTTHYMYSLTRTTFPSLSDSLTSIIF